MRPAGCPAHYEQSLCPRHLPQRLLHRTVRVHARRHKPQVRVLGNESPRSPGGHALLQGQVIQVLVSRRIIQPEVAAQLCDTTAQFF